MAKALKMASVGPVMVTIRSGQFPSEMLIRAPLWRPEGHMIIRQKQAIKHVWRPNSRLHASSSPFLLSGRKEKQMSDRLATGTPHLVVCVVTTFPMMLPTSCRRTWKHGQLGLTGAHWTDSREAGSPTFPCISSLMVSVTFSPPSDWTLMGSMSGLDVTAGAWLT